MESYVETLPIEREWGEEQASEIETKNISGPQLATNCDEKWDAINEENIHGQFDHVMEFPNFFWDEDNIPCDGLWRFVSCFTFQCCYVWTQNLEGNICITDCNGTILDLIGSQDPFRIRL